MANPDHRAKLKEGIEAWNEWRHKRSGLVPNLSEANLTGADLRHAALLVANRAELVAELGLIVLAIVWCALRFVGLDKVPPGLSTDEALAALHVECLAQTGQSADGKPWPMFASGLGGGSYTPAYLYGLYAWTRLFGISIVSIRGMTATLSILAIVGLWLLARHVADGRAARLTLVAAALSPWSFQLARLSTDAPMAPALLVWGVYLFLRSPRVAWAILGGITMALAAYTYPPVRVQMPLVVILLLVAERKRLRPARLVAFLASMFVVSLPLARRLLDGTLMGRSKALSILTADYVQAHRGQLSRPVFTVKQVMENLFEHLRPSYLFFTGDPNLRHSYHRDRPRLVSCGRIHCPRRTAKVPCHTPRHRPPLGIQWPSSPHVRTSLPEYPDFFRNRTSLCGRQAAWLADDSGAFDG